MERLKPAHRRGVPTVQFKTDEDLEKAYRIKERALQDQMHAYATRLFATFKNFQKHALSLTPFSMSVNWQSFLQCFSSSLLLLRRIPCKGV